METNALYTISEKEYNKIDTDYRGTWQDYHGDHPEWLGRRVVMSTFITGDSSEPCKLLIEGVHFIITAEGENADEAR